MRGIKIALASTAVAASIVGSANQTSGRSMPRVSRPDDCSTAISLSRHSRP